MSAELQADHTTGKNVYFLLRSSVGTIWNTASSAFQAYATVNYTDYDIAGTEQGTASGYYTANMPTSTAGAYNVVVKERLGGSPAESDPTVGTQFIQWGGTTVINNSANDIADAVLKRDFSAITGEAARSALNALRKLMNKWSFSGATLTVCKEDDSTTAYTQTATTSASADPITSLDTN